MNPMAMGEGIQGWASGRPDDGPGEICLPEGAGGLGISRNLMGEGTLLTLDEALSLALPVATAPGQLRGSDVA